MFATWTGEMGRPIAEFWRLTLREYSLVLRGHMKRREAARIDAVQIAYCQEALARRRKLPTIDTVIAWVTPQGSAEPSAPTSPLADQVYERFLAIQQMREPATDD